MVLTVEACTRLVAWTAFVWFELYRLSGERRRKYDAEMEALGTPALQVRAWLMFWIVFAVKALTVASMFFWLEYAVDVNDYSFPWVFALVFSLIVISKLWTSAFFEHTMYLSALCIACVLAGLATAVAVIMGLSVNEGDLWAVPFALWIPVTVWYWFVAGFSFEWFRRKAGWFLWPGQHHHGHHHHGHHHHGHRRSGDEERNGGTYVVVTDTQLRGRSTIHHEPAADVAVRVK